MFFIYHIMRLIFRATTFVFYHSIAAIGKSNVPKGPTILCFNHGNSLMDAMVVISSAPRVVRLTAKDTLWRSPYWGFWLSNVGTIPIKRRSDYGGTDQDNSAAFEVLYRELEQGSCVGLFPEGISRYHPSMAPLRSGVARIALDIVARNQGDFRCSIVPCGLVYLHRDKFRSDVLVRFGEPIVVNRAAYNVDNVAAIPGFARALTGDLQKGIQGLIPHAPDWTCYGLANTVRRVYKPLGKPLTLDKHVELQQSFIQIFADHAEDKAVQELKASAEVFQKKLDKFRLTTDIVRYNRPLFACFWRVVLRCLSALTLLLLAAPALALLSPVFLLAKHMEKTVLGRKGGTLQNQDEVAHYKMAVATSVLPLILLVCAGGVGFFLGRNFAIGAVFVLPLSLWMSIRWLEDGIHAARTMLQNFRWMTLSSASKADLLTALATLTADVKSVAAVYAVPEPVGQNPPLLGYFSPIRRRKKSFSELMKLHPICEPIAE